MLCGKKNKEHKFKSAHEIAESIIWQAEFPLENR